MNVKYSTILLFIVLFFVACKNPISSENESIIDFPDATNIILEMGSGINLGNVFDLGAHNFDFYELATIITIYEKVGFKHIRIPTTWMDEVNGSTLADVNGNVDFEHPRFKVLKQVIDFAIQRELYVVLNTHHERSFKANYDGSDYYNSKLNKSKYILQNNIFY